MIIEVNKNYRITSNPTCWQVEQRKSDRKDGTERWEPMFYCVDFSSALTALADLKIRLIDSSVPEEILATIRQIRDECLTAAEVYRESAG